MATAKKQSILIEFRGFVLRGNVVDLAVAVAIGAAFTAVVTAMSAAFITPLIGAIFGKADFSSLSFTINGSQFNYGEFINALISFVIVAAVIFFLVIKPVNAVMAKLGRTPSEEPVRECPECLSKVPDAATKCAYCTSALTPTAG